MFLANPAGDPEVMGPAGPAEMGVQPACEHRGPVCASARSLGGGKNGSLPPDLRAGIYPFVLQDRRSNIAKY